MPKIEKSLAQKLAGNLRTESGSTVSVVKYSTARNAAQELDRLHSCVEKMADEVQALKAELAAKNNQYAQVVAERNALRNVYENARGVLRYNGVDAARTTQYLRELDDSVEVIKEFDSGTLDLAEPGTGSASGSTTGA